MTETDATSGKMTMAFASPILRFAMPEAERLNAMLIEEAHAIRAASNGITRSNRQGWHSEPDLMKRSEPGLSALARYIKKAMFNATQAIAPQFDIAGHRLVADGWININPQHGYNVPHRHLGYQWSGCYYVTVPPVEGSPSGSIEFLSPLTVPAEFRGFGAGCYNEKMVMRPNAGDLLLFPSYLTHWVVPNESEQERITVAFNGAYLPQ